MKARFFTLVTILILCIAGFVVYLNFNKDSIPTDKAVNSEDISAQPTNMPATSVSPTPAQEEADTGIYPAFQIVDGKKLYGYIDATGKYVIKPSFNYAEEFHDNYAIVGMDDKNLVIDTTGSILYSSKSPLREYHNGAAVITWYGNDNTLYGYIDTKGKEIIKTQYKLAGDFMEDNTAYVYNGGGKYSQLDKTGTVLKSFEIDAKYNPVEIHKEYIIYYDSDHNSYGIINLKGEELKKAEYCEIKYLGEDIFALKKASDDTYGMYSALPSALYKGTGEQITDYIFYDIDCFHNGYASATDSSYTFFVDTDGNASSDLPRFDGRGTAVLYGNVIGADIDGRLSYCKKDNSIIWQQTTDQLLDEGIIAKEVKFKPNKYAYIYYPQIEGLSDKAVQNTINSDIKSLFTDSRTKLKEEDMLSVEDSFQARLMKNLLIVEKDGYDYPFGAAHGMPIMDFYYIDITNGARYELKDLFLADSKYVDKINEYITAEIAAATESENSMYFVDSFKGIAENQFFKLSESSLTIYFYPYDIAAYAAGFPEFEIPFEDIYDYIDFKGSFWNAFHSAADSAQASFRNLHL